MSAIGESIPDPRICPPQPKRPPVPQAQRTAQKEWTRDKHESINANIEMFLTDLNSRATAMSQKHDFPVRHALDLLLAAGVRTVTQRPAGNTYSAFLSVKARELQDSKSFTLC
jgi:hypothetical protein